MIDRIKTIGINTTITLGVIFCLIGGVVTANLVFRMFDKCNTVTIRSDLIHLGLDTDCMALGEYNANNN